MNAIQTKRVYDPPAPEDGARLLIDRLWPRGIKKEKLRLTGWLKEVAPGASLCQWFHHDPARWKEFQRQYAAELKANSKAWQPILQAAREGKVTLLFASADEEHNNAVVLKAFLERKLARKGRSAQDRPAKRPTARGADMFAA